METPPGNRAASVAQMFVDRVRQSPDAEASRFPVGERWTSRNWRETGEQVTRVAAGLLVLGVEPRRWAAIIRQALPLAT